MKKLIAVVVTAVLAIGLALIAIAAPASAHDNAVTADCSSLSVSLTNYASDNRNTVTVTIDSVAVTPTTNFGSSFSKTYSYSNSAAHTWHVVVTAYDSSSYNVDKSGTTTPCTTAVTPAAVTFDGPSCSSNSGYYTIPSETGVLYQVNGSTVGANTYAAPAGSTVTVTAIAANSSYTLTGTKSWVHTFPSSASGCTTIATPVAPTVHDVTTCGTGGSITLPSTPGVTYTFVTGSAGMTEGAWAVDATPASSSYVFVGLQVVHFTGNLGTKVACQTITTDPSAKDIVCVQDTVNHTAAKSDGFIEVKPFTGITYTITGGAITTPIVIVSTGTAPIDTKLPAGSYTVTASGTNLTGKTVYPLTIVDKGGLCLPTLPFTSGSIGSADQTCVSGKLVSGYITTFVDPTVIYSLNGTTLGAKTNVNPGTYTVQMAAAPGFSIDKPSATVTVNANTAPCGQLTTLAFTGGSLMGFGYLSAAALLLMAGGVFFFRSRRQRDAA